MLATGPVVRDSSTLFDSFWNGPWVAPVAAFGLKADAAGLAKVRGQIEVALSRSDKLSSFTLGPRPWGERLEAVAADLVPGAARVIWDDVSGPEIVRRMPDEMRTPFGDVREDVTITNAYVILSDQDIENLKAMRARGVRLRMLTNSLESHDVPAVNSHYKRWRRPLVQNGAELHELRADAAIREYTDTPPVSGEFTGLHTKAAVVDRRRVFIGSMNFDPRSSNWNLEMGVLVESPELARRLLAQMERDLEPDRSWRVSVDERGELSWTSGRGVLTSQPARGFFQRVQDQLFMLSPSTFY